MAIVDQPLPKCGYCGTRVSVKSHRAMTAYHFDGIRNSPEDPNRDVVLCDDCWGEYEDHWQGMWDEYYNAIGRP